MKIIYDLKKDMETLDIFGKEDSYKLSNELISQLYTNHGVLVKMKVKRHMTRMPTVKELIEKLANKNKARLQLSQHSHSSHRWVDDAIRNLLSYMYTIPIPHY